jgi:hypothetical protein
LSWTLPDQIHIQILLCVSIPYLFGIFFPSFHIQSVYVFAGEMCFLQAANNWDICVYVCV